MNGTQSKRPLARSPFVFLFLAGAFGVLFLFLSPELFRQFDIKAERKKAYELAHTRIEAAGGWQAIQKSCLEFFTNSDHGYFIGGGIDSSNSPVLSKLQPREIYLAPTPDGIPIMRIQLFGRHRTGSFDSPYFGIWVICTNVPTNYILSIDLPKHGMTKIIERKGDLIFEVR
jgi:hypothetical protein